MSGFPGNLTEGIAYFAITTEARKVRKKFGDRADGYMLHGLRRPAAVQRAEGRGQRAEGRGQRAEGAISDAEMQSVTGPQKRLSKSAQMRRESPVIED